MIVGVGDMMLEDDQSTSQNMLVGDIMAVVAMMFWAGQLTYEEKFVKKVHLLSI